MKVKVIINESHEMFDEQEQILRVMFDNFDLVHVPKEGWKIEEILTMLEYFEKEDSEQVLVFVSPIPSMIVLATTAFSFDVHVFHNDKREKVELPDGRVISKVAETGWVFV